MKRRNIIVFIWLIGGVFTSVFAQDKGNETAADNTLRGSGRVNASTLGMEFALPLGSYPGRGINVPINMSYSSKLWRMEYLGNSPLAGTNYSPCHKQYAPVYSENSASGWTTSLAVPYIEYLGGRNFYNADGTPYSYDDATCPDSQTPNESYPFHYVRRIVVHLPGGETHELRPDDTVFSFTSGDCINNPNTCDPNDPTYPSTNMWNATYYAADGSNIKYIQNSSTNTYRLLMPDGSFYDFNQTATILSNRKATTFTDRNGNYTTYNNSNGTWTDTLGRTLSAPIGLTAPAVGIYTYSMPGMTGTYKFNWKQLKGNSASDSALTNFSDNLKYLGETYGCTSGGIPTTCTHPSGTYLFGGDPNYVRIVSGTLFNPVVLAEIELPTGQKYKFSYDIYGKIEKIIYPTGGEEVFQYSVVPTLSMLDPTDSVGGQTNFGVTNRKVYKYSGDTSPYEWTYSAGYVTQQEGYKVTISNPDGTKVERYLHRGNNSIPPVGTFGFDNGLAGMAYEERGYDSSNPQKLMSKKVTNWTQSALALNPNNGTYSPPWLIAHWHPRVTSQESIIYDTTGNGVSATMTYEYEDEANLNLRETPLLTKKSSQYAFVVAGNPPPSVPVRTSETTFLINDANISQSTRDIYKAQNMVGLATASVVKDGAGTIVSRSEMIYDQAGYSPNIGRGNPTTARVWDSTKGSWDNPSAYLQTRAKFDVWGNQYETIDAKGNSTFTEFDSTYHAFPIKVTSAVPDPTNTHGSNAAFETTATFNTTTGLPLTTTDANGLETRIEYDAATLRPLNTKTYYQNTQIGGMSETIYHDEPNNYWVKSRTQIDTDKWAESISYFDGLGRAYKSEEFNSQGNIFVEKEFDEDGRVKRVTNPFRANETKIWTTNVYDESSRIKEVVLPDGAKVKTDYGVSVSGLIGVTKTITDQAGKKRKGISDALGRMVRVIEDPDGQNLSTDYVFDTLGNLRKTIQGEQNRYFTYDSLGRLLYAKQPEQEANTAFVLTDAITNNSQWSVKYQYDDNGNIVSTTDARGVSVTGIYDNFNRLKTRDYSDSTPDVSFYYDGRGLPTVPNFSKGKTTKVSSSVSENRYTSFNNLGQLLTAQQITDGQTYDSSYQFDAFGKLLSQTYPSGRTVKVDYNADGDVSSIWGTVGNNNRLYANGFHYNSAGATDRMRLGNGKWETYAYNNRLQITEIGLGSSASDKGLLKLEYGYGTNTQNNGSLRSQKISFNGLAQPFEQTYTYDDLNRLLSATETVNGSQTWRQTFTYDRYGNRRFDAANTTTLLQNNNITNPEISTADNRFSSGQNYLYDKTGNLTQDASGMQFLYDAENHQKEVKNDSNETVGLYLYDGEGKRVKKISASETVIFVYNGGGQPVAEYLTNVVPPAETKISYLTTDHLGSPRVMTDSTGQVIARKDFGAFGDETFTTQRTEALGYKPENIRQDYTGYQKDDESGLEFAQARYYNTNHGRFTSVDPLTASANVKDPQTFNRYTYALNSPYKFTDPLGLKPSKKEGERPYNQELADFLDRNMTDASVGYRATYEPETSSVIAGTSGESSSESNSNGESDETSQVANPPVAPPVPTAEQNTETKQDKDSETAYVNYNGVVIMAYGESGTVHNVGGNFERAARTAGAALEAVGIKVLYFAIKSIDGFQGLLDTAAKEGASTINLFTHGDWDAVYLGDGVPDEINTITMNNVKKLVNKAKNLSRIYLYACNVGSKSNGIAAQLSKQLNVNIHAPTGGLIFSTDPTKPTGEKIHPDKGPTYMVNSGGGWKMF